MKEKKILIIGMMDDAGFEQDNRIYSCGYVAPTLRARPYGSIRVLRKMENESDSDSTKGQTVKSQEN